jgi:hypothetical protein
VGGAAAGGAAWSAVLSESLARQKLGRWADQRSYAWRVGGVVEGREGL